MLVFTRTSAYIANGAEVLSLSVKQFECTSTLANTDVILRDVWPPHLEDSIVVVFKTDYLKVVHPFAQWDGAFFAHLVEVAGYYAVVFNGNTSVALYGLLLVSASASTEGCT